MDVFDGMITIELKGGVKAGEGLVNRIEICPLAVSLGDVRTLICRWLLLHILRYLLKFGDMSVLRMSWCGFRWFGER